MEKYATRIFALISISLLTSGPTFGADESTDRPGSAGAQTYEAQPGSNSSGQKPSTPSRPAAEENEKGKSLIKTASEKGGFNTLTSALEQAGLADVLEGSGPFTLFAPNDDAFDALPEGTLEELMEPQNRQQLLQILAFHIVPGEVKEEDVQTGPLSTGLGVEAQVEVDDDTIRINQARVIEADIVASNGVIHTIDRVIVPDR